MGSIIMFLLADLMADMARYDTDPTNLSSNETGATSDSSGLCRSIPEIKTAKK
jgi:hypothetical protein